eukprot:gb/GEZN01011898.1/.p1 GENE.gb/GEZN01011898.1/~~gb/GEZN01011898.1/.p1  ORF type:complete len:279 (+),score=38.96 gb/GEZN01011898.1/:85-921(+)
MEPACKVRVLKAGEELCDGEEALAVAVAGEKGPRQHEEIRELTTPPPTKPQKLWILSERLQKCQNVLAHLMHQNWAPIFSEPVNHVALGLCDYPRIISQPMDLGTVKSRLEAGQYPSSACFAADVRLVWANAQTFNPPSSFVHQQATRFSEMFEKKFRRVAERGGRRSDDRRDRSRGDDVEPSVHDVESSEATKKALKTPWLCKPLTLAEKLHLKNGILALKEKSEPSLESIVAIIRKAAPDTEKGEYVVVNLNDLEAPTLRELQVEVVRVAATLELR